MSSRLGDTKNHIKKIQERIRKKRTKYVLGKGKQKAKTVARSGTVIVEASTTANMHSEMVVIAKMLLKKKWKLTTTGTIKMKKGDTFTTEEPHCGTCTVMLEALDMPLSKPTLGRHKLSCDCIYPLPDELKRSSRFIINMLGGKKNMMQGYYNLKSLINKMRSNPGPDEWVLSVDGMYIHENITMTRAKVIENDLVITTWNEVINHDNGSVLSALWYHINRAIADANKEIERFEGE